MRQLRMCMRCGREAADVTAKPVDLEAEAAREGRRVRTVEVELVHEMRHVREVTRVTVPERYGTEYRCQDPIACEARYLAQLDEERRAAAPTTTETEEEDVPWL